jgi:DNA replicative helicase MCM subunit Mcm2 (Cdc46/Mcm family)
VQNDGVWVSRPGYLPLAHRGVFAIQDFHAVKDAQREKLLGIFNMVMEDGQVIDSTAARQTYPALTSIHLDTNKRTDLFPDSQLRGDTIIARRLDDIRIPMTILSRFDVIIDIPRDPERQREVALAMYQQPVQVQGTTTPAQRRSAWSRKLKVLVALLRTEHAEISFPESIRRHMRRQQEQLWQGSKEELQKFPWLNDFQTRLTNSVFKFVAAYARMNDRKVPVVQDVDVAFRLMTRKYAFVATLAHCLTLPRTSEVPESHDLARWLHEQFAGQQCSTGEILAAYRESFGIEPVRRTIERHLPRVARRVRKGRWDFPRADG